jgi:hypothetical protein
LQAQTSNTGIKIISIRAYPGTSATGQYYDEFGFPDFTNDVPVMDGGIRAIYTPSGGIKGSDSDLSDANDWAIKSRSEGGGGLINEVNFRRKGTQCEILNDKGNWVLCTWHHHQDGKTLMPVPSNVHNRTYAAHVGGVRVYAKDIVGFFDSPKFLQHEIHQFFTTKTRYSSSYAGYQFVRSLS